MGILGIEPRQSSKTVFQGKPTRDHHTDSLTGGLVAGCTGDLLKSCSPESYSLLLFMPKTTSVSQKQNYRRHLRIFLELWTKSLKDWVSIST